MVVFLGNAVVRENPLFQASRPPENALFLIKIRRVHQNMSAAVKQAKCCFDVIHRRSMSSVLLCVSGCVF